MVIERKTFAGLFPNALEISTADKKYYFGSFVTRDHAYQTITQISANYDENEIISGHPELSKNTGSNTSNEKSLKSASHDSLKSHISGFQLINSDAKNGLASIMKNSPDMVRRKSKKGNYGNIVHQKHPISKAPIARTLSQPFRVPKPRHDNPKIDTETTVVQPPAVCSCSGIHRDQKDVIDTILPAPFTNLRDLLYTFDSARNGFLHTHWDSLKYTGK